MANPFYTRVYNAIPFTFAKAGPLNTEFGRLQNSFDLVDAALAKYPGNDTVYVVAGKVGIGTAAPAAKLDVAGNVGALVEYSFGQPNWSYKMGSAASGHGYLSNVQGVVSLKGGATYYGGGQYQLDAGRTAGGSLTINVDGSIAFSNGAGAAGSLVFYAERMRIDSSGNLVLSRPIPSQAPTYIRDNTDLSNITLQAGSTAGVYSNIEVMGWNGTGSLPRVAFSTAGVERMRIDNGGNLQVGQTASGYANSNSHSLAINGVNFINHVNGSASGNAYVAFGYAGAGIGFIVQNGTTGVLYNVSSDHRLKLDQQPLMDSGAFIDAVRPKTWKWLQDGSRGVGFIAHEFQAVSPSSVSGEKDAVDEDGKPIYQSMQASSPEAMANIFAELQSLRRRVAALEGLISPRPSYLKPASQ